MALPVAPATCQLPRSFPCLCLLQPLQQDFRINLPALAHCPHPIPIERPLPFWAALTLAGAFLFWVLGVVAAAAAAAASFVCCLAILYALLAKLPFAGPLHSLFRYVVYIVTVAAFFALQLAFTVGFYVCILCV